MVKFFANKIMTKEIKEDTGKAFAIEDVPERWRAKVAEELEE